MFKTFFPFSDEVLIDFPKEFLNLTLNEYFPSVLASHT